MLDYDREYLRNLLRYQKSGTNLIDIYSCLVQQNKIGELWFSNKKVTSVDVDPPKFRIWHDFGQLQTLTAYISGMDRHTKNR